MLSPNQEKVWFQTGRCRKASEAQGQGSCPCTAEELVPGSNSKEKKKAKLVKKMYRWRFSNNFKHPFQDNGTRLGSFFAMFLRAMMASAWSAMERDVSVGVWAMGRIFVIGLMLSGRPAFPRTFRCRMISLIVLVERASDRRLWMN